MKIIVKEPKKEAKETDIDGLKYRTDICKLFIKDAYFESVIVYDNPTDPSLLVMMVDEEGLMKELPINFLIEHNSPVFPIQKIVGTAVFIRIKKIGYNDDVPDYEVIDLTEGDRIRVACMLQGEYQERLRIRFGAFNNPLY